MAFLGSLLGAPHDAMLKGKAAADAQAKLNRRYQSPLDRIQAQYEFDVLRCASLADDPEAHKLCLDMAAAVRDEAILAASTRDAHNKAGHKGKGKGKRGKGPKRSAAAVDGSSPYKVPLILSGVALVAYLATRKR